jgi:hypothetical protein
MKAITRRQFVRAVTVLGVAGLSGCGQPFPIGPGIGTGVFAYRRSGRGIKGISNAAKKHNANHVYATMAAAVSDPAHPGDHSRVVRIVMNANVHALLFGGGNSAVDLRQSFSQM